MTDYFNLVLLGIIQGLTEFLPVSSSGHIVLAKEFLDIKYPGTLIEVTLHLGTLASIIIFYFNDIARFTKGVFLFDQKSINFMLKIVLGILPAGLIGIFFKDFFVSYFNDLFATSLFLVFTGFILFLSKFMEQKFKPLGYKSVLAIGLIQAFAIFPGISRSGMTISGALFLGIEKKEAFKLSFFLAIPIIVGASILEIKNIVTLEKADLAPLSIGFIISFITGYISIKLLYDILMRNKFWLFSFYCFFVGIIGIISAR